MKIEINRHSSYHDCETCGLSINDVYTLSGDLGNFCDGDEAYCYDSYSGYLSNVTEFVLNALEEKGFVFERFSQHAVNELFDTIDWDTYWNLLNLDPDMKDPVDVQKYNELEQSTETFYRTGWLKVLEDCGVEVEFTFTQDELDDWE